MTKLKQLLYSDLGRQLRLEGRKDSRPNFARVAQRLLHYRFLPIVLCRLSRAAMLHRLSLLSRIFSYLNFVLFGLEVSPRCEIGPGIFFPHCSGTVIGAWRVGSDVTIFQGVTLGARELDMGFNTSLRPSIGDHVTLGAGAKILGGIHIGDYAVVGANAVVLDSVAAASVVVGIPAHALARERQPRADIAATALQ
jgi:serine O-acetyltransferase